MSHDQFPEAPPVANRTSPHQWGLRHPAALRIGNGPGRKSWPILLCSQIVNPAAALLTPSTANMNYATGNLAIMGLASWGLAGESDCVRVLRSTPARLGSSRFSGWRH